MKIHITNLYNLNPHDELVEKQHRFANAGRELGFTEMGIFSYAVKTDSSSELNKRLDGIIAAMESEDVVIMQLPTRNEFEYESLLFNKIKAYRNTKIILVLHDLDVLSNYTDIELRKKYISLYKKADCIIHNSIAASDMLTGLGITKHLFCDESYNLDSHITAGLYIKKILLDAVTLALPLIPTHVPNYIEETDNMIQIGFGLHDKNGDYSMWVGTTMTSIIEHTCSPICFHILHDDTLSTENIYKLTQVAHSGGHQIVFHLLDAQVFSFLPEQISKYTVGTMFRVMLPELLPQLDRIIYLDADLYVNGDISELWETNISDYYLAAIPDLGVRPWFTNLPYPITHNLVTLEKYFNAGVLYLNLHQIRNKGNMKEEVLDYLIKNPESLLFDQDALNVIYGQKVLYLDNTWNYFTVEYRSKKLHDLDKKIYHYARDVIKLYTCSPLDIAYYETIHRTPWGKQCATEILTKSMSRQLDRTHQLCAAIPFMCNTSIKKIFYGHESFAMKNLYKMLSLKQEDYRILSNPTNDDSCILPCKDFSSLSSEIKGNFIIFVLPEADNWTAISKLKQLGLTEQKDFFSIPCLLPPELGGFV